VRWTENELCRHILITGDTGCGKTSSGFHPILVQLTRNVTKWGGLMLGVKGDEHEFLTDLMNHHERPKDVVKLEVRVPQQRPIPGRHFIVTTFLAIARCLGPPMRKQWLIRRRA